MVQKSKPQNDKSSKTTVLIVDDHPIVRQGLSELVNNEEDFNVCGQAEDAHQAMALIKSLKPQMIIVDISLKETSGIDLIKDIKTNYPQIMILALSMHDETLYAERALRAGAQGYVMKTEAIEKVIDALRKIRGGRIFVSENMAGKLMHKLVGGGPEAFGSAIDNLSDRELEVFSLIGEGFGTRQIAERLHLSIKTIETYRAHIKDKLNLADASELLQYAIRWVNSGKN
ncbi:MAG: response regulator transcription factor [Phycisphaerae bacterium]